MKASDAKLPNGTTLTLPPGVPADADFVPPQQLGYQPIPGHDTQVADIEEIALTMARVNAGAKRRYVQAYPDWLYNDQWAIKA